MIAPHIFARGCIPSATSSSSSSSSSAPPAATIFDAQLCHTLPCHRHLSHTQLCHTHTHTQRCHTHTNLSHTTLSHTHTHLSRIQLCRTHTHTLSGMGLVHGGPLECRDAKWGIKDIRCLEGWVASTVKLATTLLLNRKGAIVPAIAFFGFPTFTIICLQAEGFTHTVVTILWVLSS